MKGNLRFTAVFVTMFFALTASAQWRTARDITEGARGSIAGEVIDVDEGRNRLQLETDGDQTHVTVESDSVATQYNGFGTMIAGKPEIFLGSRGFSNVRLGDRIEVRGTGRGTGALVADTVTLLGRSVAAGSVGVGSTRTPTNASTPTNDRVIGTTGSTSTTGGRAEGTVRQINADENRLVIQTPQRRMVTVRTYRNTPVYYRGEVYSISNLEVGDRITVEADPRDAQADDITARRIDVVEGVGDTATTPTTGRTVGAVTGRVTRVETVPGYVWIDTGRGEVRIDMSRAEDADGRRIGPADLRTGDQVDLSGNYNAAGDVFIASTVRFQQGYRRATNPVTDLSGFGLVTITGILTETLEDDTTIAIRERTGGTMSRVWVAEDFLVKLKTTTTTAERLRANDDVRVTAFRDSMGNLIAQTITVRNR
jgi:hypothetical protein